MSKFLQSILLFDVALPGLLLGVPCLALLWAVLRFQSFVDVKVEEHAAYEAQSRQVAALNVDLLPMRPQAALLKALLSNDDIETKLDHGIAAGLEKFSNDEVETTLHDYQFGASTIGPNFGEGRRLSLKLSSHWEALNTAAAEWETRFPNLILESLSIDPTPASPLSGPYLQSTLSYFVVTEN